MTKLLTSDDISILKEEDLLPDEKEHFKKMQLGEWSVLDVICSISKINFASRQTLYDVKETMNRLSKYPDYFSYSISKIDKEMCKIIDLSRKVKIINLGWPERTDKKHVWFYLNAYIQNCVQQGLIKQDKSILDYFPLKYIKRNNNNRYFSITEKGLLYQTIRFNEIKVNSKYNDSFLFI